MSDRSIDLSQAINLENVLNKTQEQKATQLPSPSGYRILCAIPEAEKEYDSGLVKADETLRIEEVLTTVLFVCLKLDSDIFFLGLTVSSFALIRKSLTEL